MMMIMMMMSTMIALLQSASPMSHIDQIFLTVLTAMVERGINESTDKG